MRGTDKGHAPAHKGILTRNERVRLMAATGCDERTIRKWERGEEVKEATDVRLTTAAKRLGIVVPKR
jgi:hypothetical protein